MNKKTTPGLITPGRLHMMAAAAVFLITFFIYNSTKAPTLSFWDCGEFIACSYVLGIPHPPGSPVYIMLGRVFSVIPFQTDICARINMLSALTGALAAMFAFLVTFRLIKMWWRDGDVTGWKRGIAYIGAVVGTSMFSFGRTHWNNCLEAEVYTPAMLVLIVILWLTLRWLENRHDPKSDRYLIGITFLGFLSIGIHMTTFLFMPAVFLIIVLFSERLRRDFRFYITGICLFLISFSFDWFLWAGLIWLVVCIGGSLGTKQYLWRFSLLLVLAAIVGFSSQMYTPIRSAQKPPINQNNPSESFSTFERFLERKQYGEESMLTRALKRRAEWVNQLGNHPRIGFWGFFSEQFGMDRGSFAIPFVLGLLGLFEMIRRRPKLGLPLLLMIILGTLFLVWYMNFADGTRQHPMTGEGHLEVRDRDYFFTPGFILFGIAIGLGMAGLMEMIRELFDQRSSAWKTPLMTVLTLVALLLTVIPVRANHFYCDRSRNYIPYDFAVNLLNSCDPNAILFNGGDNDTFPIWCVQAVYNTRPDVSAVNLALSNTRWYIQQIRDYMKIPLRFSDAEIDALRIMRSPTGRPSRIQDQVLDEIVRINAQGDDWKRPINFALTVGTEARQYRGRDLANLLALKGMVYRLYRSEPPGSILMEESMDLFYHRYLFRSLADSTIFKDERTRSLTGNYTTAMVLMADSLKKVGRFNEAIDLVKKAGDVVPFEYQTFNYLTQLYVETNRQDSIPALTERVPPDKVREIYFIWAYANKQVGNTDQAKTIFKKTLDMYPTYTDVIREYALLLYEGKDIGELRDAAKIWLDHNPNDEQTRMFLEDLIGRLSREPIPDNS